MPIENALKEGEDEVFDELLRRVARTPDVAAVRRDVRPGSELAQRFSIEKKLGEGASGQVFAAVDSVRKTRVALKLLGILTPQSIEAIKREFRVAAELVNPHLVRLHELFSDGPNWFFTMELLEGVTLSQLRASGEILDATLLRDLFTGLALGLSELHRAGALHGDLKPSNFLIVGRERRAVILDFGLTRPLNLTEQRPLPAGTPAYMAPEQAAGRYVSEAADWYSFGVVLFEALTGSLPPSPFRPERLELPPGDLSRLCLDLLHPDPDARPKRGEVLSRLGSADKKPRASSRPPRSMLVGRGRELEALRAVYDTTAQGTPAFCLISGESGIGKTALIEHFVSELKSLGATVLRGRCGERESVSYKAVDGLIDDLIQYLDELPTRTAAALLPEGIGELTRLFPTLRTVAAVAHAYKPNFDVSDHSLIRRQAIHALRDLLAGVRRRAPLVLWVDDLQWGDKDSAALLEPLLTGSKPVSLLFIGSYRPISGAAGATLDALRESHPVLPNAHAIELLPLAPAEAELLARQLLPRDDPESAEVARTIAREAGGHPLFIAELAHGSAAGSEPVLRCAPATLGEIVQSRVTTLPSEVRGLLEATALAGTPLTHTVAKRARSLDPDAAERALDILRANRLVRTQQLGDERVIDMHHDRIREIVVQSLPQPMKEQHHRALARALEAEPRRNPEALAGHLEAAGDRVEAGRYWIEAGQVAFEALAFGYAAKLYQRGIETAGLDLASLRALKIRRAEALAYAGEGEASAEAYLDAAKSHAREEAIDLRRRAAEQLLLSGHLERGLDVIELVLKELGMRKTRSGRRAFWSVVRGRVLVRARGLRFRQRDESELSRAELSRIDTSWTIAWSLGVVDFMRGADFQNDHLLLALRAGEPRRLLRALSIEIAYAATPGVGSDRRAREVLVIADELAAQVGSASAAGLVRLSQGMAAYLQGRFDEALAKLEQALGTLSDCSGTVWEAITAQRFIIASLFQLGRFARLAALVPPLLAETDAKGNRYATTFFRTTYSNAAWLVSGNVATAREQLERARREWTAPGVQLPHAWMFVSEAHLAFYTGEVGNIWQRLLTEWPGFVDAHFLRISVVSVQLWHLRAQCALFAARHLNRSGDRSGARDLLDEARRSALRLARERLALAAPLSDLLLAAIDGADGDEERARQRLARCANAFEQQDMRLYAAAANARLGQLLGSTEGSAFRRRARLAFESEDVLDFERMLDVLAPPMMPRVSR